MGLKTNQTLRKLDLQHNPIGPNGAHELDTLRHATGRLIRVEDKIEMAALGPLDEVEPTRTSVEADWMAGVSRASGVVMYQSTDYAEAFGGSTSSSTAVPGAGKIVGGGRLVDSGSQKSTQVPGSSRGSSRPTSAKRSRSRPTSAKSERSSVTLNSMGVPIRADGSSYKDTTKRGRSRDRIQNKLGAVYFPALKGKQIDASKPSSGQDIAAAALSHVTKVVQITQYEALQPRYSLGNGESYRPTLTEIRMRGLTPTRHSSRPSSSGAVGQSGSAGGGAPPGRSGAAAAITNAARGSGRKPLDPYRTMDENGQPLKRRSSIASPSSKGQQLPIMSKVLPPAYYSPSMTLQTHPKPGEVLLRDTFRKSYRHRYSPEFDFLGSVTHHDLFDKITKRADTKN
eukprot:g1827.t1